MTANNTCETCGQTLPPAVELPVQEPAHAPAQEPAQEHSQEPTLKENDSLDGFAAEYTELVKQLPLSARVKLAAKLQKAGIPRNYLGDSVLLPLQAAVAGQVHRRTVAKASSAAKRLLAKEAVLPGRGCPKGGGGSPTAAKE